MKFYKFAFNKIYPSSQSEIVHVILSTCTYRIVQLALAKSSSSHLNQVWSRYEGTVEAPTYPLSFQRSGRLYEIVRSRIVTGGSRQGSVETTASSCFYAICESFCLEEFSFHYIIDFQNVLFCVLLLEFSDIFCRKLLRLLLRDLHHHCRFICIENLCFSSAFASQVSELSPFCGSLQCVISSHLLESLGSFMKREQLADSITVLFLGCATCAKRISLRLKIHSAFINVELFISHFC